MMEQALLNYLNTTQKLLLVHMRIFLCVSQSPVSQLSRLMRILKAMCECLFDKELTQWWKSQSCDLAAERGF